jgi:hypothetical protein
VRCPHSGGEYQTLVSEGALDVVDRCAERGRGETASADVEEQGRTVEEGTA